MRCVSWRFFPVVLAVFCVGEDLQDGFFSGVVVDSGDQAVVVSGASGDVVIGKARELLEMEFPEIAARVAIHVPDEKTRRVGQAVVAASLPKLRK